MSANHMTQWPPIAALMLSRKLKDSISQCLCSEHSVLATIYFIFIIYIQHPRRPFSDQETPSSSRQAYFCKAVDSNWCTLGPSL